MSEELSSESRVLGALCYVFGLILTIIIFLVKKDDKYIRYHAAQAMIFDIFIMIFFSVVGMGIFVLLFLFVTNFFMYFWVLWLLLMGVSLVLLIIRIFFAWRAYGGSQFRLPIISNFADKLTEK